jgi:hypothetical protein
LEYGLNKKEHQMIKAKFFRLAAVLIGIVVMVIVVKGETLSGAAVFSLLFSIPGLLIVIWWWVGGQVSTNPGPGQAGYQSPPLTPRLLEAQSVRGKTVLFDKLKENADDIKSSKN